jgi:hypothetical protein
MRVDKTPYLQMEILRGNGDREGERRWRKPVEFEPLSGGIRDP